MAANRASRVMSRVEPHSVPESGIGTLTEAYVSGTPVIALCGKVWVPSRDPERFPICPESKCLYDLGSEGRRREWERRACEEQRG